MVVTLDCYSVESGTRHDSGEAYTVALFLDRDPEDRLAAFLKYSGEDAKNCVPGQAYQFSLIGLSPAKGDKSSFYIRGKVRNAKSVKVTGA